MTGQSEVEILQRLLVEAEQALKNERSRLKNVADGLVIARAKVGAAMDVDHWDDAQTALLQAKVLSVKHGSSVIDVENAENRVATLKAGIVREEARIAKIPVGVPYQPSPKQETPAAVAPAAEPVVPAAVAPAPEPVAPVAVAPIPEPVAPVTEPVAPIPEPVAPVTEPVAPVAVAP